MNNVLLYLGGLVVAALVALFAIPLAIDWNSYRGAFEEEASRLLGREVRVGGKVNLRLLPVPYVRFEKVRIADTGGRFGEPFLRMDSFTMWLSVPPLLKGAVEANEIELNRPQLRLGFDEKGRGNWQSFDSVRTNLPFAPRDLSLPSVKIVDGLLAVHARSGQELVRFQAVNGEFSAPALDGPYRFRGSIKQEQALREVRFSTSRIESDGSAKLKATVRVAETGTSYIIDGRILELAAKPRLEGELLVSLPAPKGAVAKSAPAPPKAKSRAKDKDFADLPADAPGAEIKAAIKLDAVEMQLSDISITFEQDGRPQLMSGEAIVAWPGELVTEAHLSARWLDLDRIVGAGEALGPAHSFGRVIGLITGFMPAQGKARVGLRIDQATLGSEMVNGVVVDLDRTGESLRIAGMRALLPGGSSVFASGALGNGRDTPYFQGQVNARGSSLVRLLAWAAKGTGFVELKGDRYFSVSADVLVEEGSVALKSARGELGPTLLGGDISYRWTGRRALEVAMSSDRIDVNALWPTELGIADVRRMLLPQLSAKPSAADALAARPKGAEAAKGIGHVVLPADLDLHVNMSVGHMQIGSHGLRDVQAELNLLGGTLKMPLLRFASDEGLGVEAEGEIGVSAGRPAGSIRMVVEAEQPAAVVALGELFAAPDWLRPGPDRARLVAPLRLAGSLVLGGRTPGAADLVLDGVAQDSRVTLTARFDGGFDGWRRDPTEMTAQMVNRDGARLLRQIVPQRRNYREVLAAAEPKAAAHPGRASLRLSGIPRDGLSSAVRIETSSLDLKANGRIVASDEDPSFKGDVTLATRDAADVFALMGVGSSYGLAASPLEAAARISGNRSSVKIEAGKVRALGTTVSLAGTIGLGATADAAPAADLSMSVAELSLPRVLGFLLEPPSELIASAKALVEGGRELWPDRPFDMLAASRIRGKVQLSAGSVHIDDGLRVGKAAMQVEIGDRTVLLKSLEGQALGGKVIASARLEAQPAGAGITGQLRIVDASLEEIAREADGQPVAKGRANLSLEFSGKGLSPRGLVGLMSGKGSLDITQASLRRLSPGAVEGATEALLGGDPAATDAGLPRLIAEHMRAGRLTLGNRSLAIDVADGVLRIPPVAVEAEAARVLGRNQLDLATFRLDSDWRIEPRPQPVKSGEKERGALPAVSVSYSGPIGSLARLEPQINVEALEREMTVRRMEREVDRLEQLRLREQAVAGDQPGAPANAAAGAAGKAAAGASAATASQGAATEVVPSSARDRMPAPAASPQLTVPFPVPAGRPAAATQARPASPEVKPGSESTPPMLPAGAGPLAGLPGPTAGAASNEPVLPSPLSERSPPALPDRTTAPPGKDPARDALGENAKDGPPAKPYGGIPGSSAPSASRRDGGDSGAPSVGRRRWDDFLRGSPGGAGSGS